MLADLADDGRRNAAALPGTMPASAGSSVTPIMPADAKPSCHEALALPRLSLALRSLVRALAAAAGYGTWVWARARRTHGVTLYAATCAIILTVNGIVTRISRLIARHSKLVEPQRLATRDSRFAVLDALTVHYVERTPTVLPAQGLSALVHMNHGFGASCLSWLDVLSPLANGLSAVALAHDRTGFGLTDRPPDLSAYAYDANREMARGLLATVSAMRACEGAPHLLIGHSMGAYLSVLQAVEHPARVRGLVLVAPALSPRRDETGIRLPRPGVAGKGASGLGAVQGASSAAHAAAKRAGVVLTLVRFAIRSALTAPLTVLLAPLLRTAVYSRAFWAKGLSAAWFDRSRLTEATLDRYRRPSLARRWDDGLIRFVQAVQATSGESAYRSGRGALDALLDAQVPVLIVHGVQDRVVPITNSRALRTALGARCTLVELDGCGHVPHEECPERFLEAALPWLRDRVGQHYAASTTAPNVRR